MKKHTQIQITPYIFLALFFHLGSARANEIDCSNQVTAIAGIVCMHPKLRDLNQRLNYLTQEDIENSQADNKLQEQIKQTHSTWQTQIRNACQDEACLTKVFSERIKTLEEKSLKALQEDAKEEVAANTPPPKDNAVDKPAISSGNAVPQTSPTADRSNDNEKSSNNSFSLFNKLTSEIGKFIETRDWTETRKFIGNIILVLGLIIPLVFWYAYYKRTNQSKGKSKSLVLGLAYGSLVFFTFMIVGGVTLPTLPDTLTAKTSTSEDKLNKIDIGRTTSNNTQPSTTSPDKKANASQSATENKPIIRAKELCELGSEMMMTRMLTWQRLGSPSLDISPDHYALEGHMREKQFQAHGFASNYTASNAIEQVLISLMREIDRKNKFYVSRYFIDRDDATLKSYYNLCMVLALSAGLQ